MTFPGGPKTLAWELLHYFCSDHHFQEKNLDPWCDNCEYVYGVMIMGCLKTIAFQETWVKWPSIHSLLCSFIKCPPCAVTVLGAGGYSEDKDTAPDCTELLVSLHNDP